MQVETFSNGVPFIERGKNEWKFNIKWFLMHQKFVFAYDNGGFYAVFNLSNSVIEKC